MFCLKLKLRGYHPKCSRSAQIWQSELKEPATTRCQSENVSLKKRMLSACFFTLGMPIRAAPKRHFQEIRGNRTFHSIWSMEKSFHIKLNKLMCYCKFCLYEEYNADSNKNCVSNWEERAIQKGSQPEQLLLRPLLWPPLWQLNLVTQQESATS